jgi:diguanylate cyclase (GGDEF)-like protein/PAS domain S-box-containing protein
VALLARRTGRAPDGAFPVPVLLLTAALGAAGIVGGLAGQELAGAGAMPSWPTVISLLVLLTAAPFPPLEFQYRDQVATIDPFEAILAPAVFLLPPVALVAIVGISEALSERLQRIHPVKACFNVAQWMAAASAGSIVFHLVRVDATMAPRNLPALVLAMATISLVNLAALLLVLLLTRGQPLRTALAELAPAMFRGALVGLAINLAFGIIFAATAAWLPEATLLLLVPLAALHFAGRAYASVRADRARLAGMQLAAHVLTVPMNPRDAVPQFLAEVRRCFESEVAELVILLEDSRVVHRSHEDVPDGEQRIEEIGRETVAAALVRTGQAVRVSEDDDDTDLTRRLREEGWRDCLAAPVRVEGKVIGVLCTYNRTGFEGFEEGELQVLDALAAEVGTAIEKGELLEAILEERTKLSEIVDNTSDGIAALDPDGTVSSWNPGFEEITGYRSADMVGSRGLARLRPRDVAGREVQLDRWAEGPGALPSVVEVLRPHGEACWLACSWTRVPAVDGRPRRLILTSRDITKELELKRAEKALRDSAARFRALVQNSSHMVIVVDAGGGITYASPAFRRMLGYRDNARVGQSVFELIHPDDAGDVRARFGEHLAGLAQGPGFGFRFLAADGSWRNIEALANNLLDDPAVGGVVFNCRDVTERTRAEGQLAGQAQVLDLIARDAPLMETLDALAKVIEAEASGARCAILLLDDSSETLTVAAAPSLIDVGLHEADGLVIGPEAGASGTAAFRREPVFSADVARDRLWNESRQVALARGIRAAWATPIIAADGGPVLGVLTVYFDEPRRPGPAERSLLELAAHLADIAIERSHAQAQLAHQAAHDALTGLPNRVFFLDRITLALARTQRSRSSVAVLFLDLDRFKFINDSLGHDAGDRLLVALGKRLQDVIRPGDTVARFGGDEFTILCEGIADEAHALAIAERVAQVATAPFPLGDAEVFVTMSIGIALASGSRVRPESLVENADAAMYRAKARGGNRREVFDQAMRARAKRRLAMHSSLHRAVERGEFRVLYQPIHRLGSGRAVGAEALVRWEHPDRGLIGPGEFIALAEETGLIMSIGTQVLGQACRQARIWQAENRRLAIKVNLSARQFVHPNLAGVVAEILAETGIDPALVYLEITETVLMEDVESTSTALAELKSLGVSLTVDDFGTGYSSLAYLKRFPVDELKIDRDFVAGLLSDQEDQAIVTAIINLAHILGVVAVAEGVENAGQMRRLRELGCDLGQGYHFGQPLPPEDLTARLSPAAAAGQASQDQAPPAGATRSRKARTARS